MSALTGLDTHSLSHHPRFGHIVQQLMKETTMAAMADSEILTEKDADEMYELICDFDPIKTSMLVDLEKGRKEGHRESIEAISKPNSTQS